ncbi:MAG: hypothetical protein ACRDWH_11615 [Acidimicrobiia bacterium]
MLDDLAEADLFSESQTVLETPESAAVEEVGSVHNVPGLTQFVGEGEES